MKPINTFLTMLSISLLSPASWSETMDDLVERGGFYYQKFTDVPFTGKVTGNQQCSIKNGQREGAWVGYHDSGTLKRKGNYKNGYQEGVWVHYYENTQLEYKGNYKDGYQEGAWISYYKVVSYITKVTTRTVREKVLGFITKEMEL